MRGLRVDDDVPAEQHAADNLPGVPGCVLRVGGQCQRSFFEVVVHGGAMHADGFGDLGDCVLPARTLDEALDALMAARSTAWESTSAIAAGSKSTNA